jgi:tetratricopeptide (TPR) repeat protein
MNTFLTFVFSLLLLACNAQFVLSPEVNRAQELIMDLRFDEAKILLIKEKKARPKNGMVPYLQSNILFLQSIINSNYVDYEPALDSLEKLIELVEDNAQDSSAMYKYTLAEMHFELGTLHMVFGYNWSSAWVMLDAFSYIKKNAKAPAGFMPHYMANGVLNVAMGSLPGKYKTLASLMGYSGDVQTGLAQLKKATELATGKFSSFHKKAVFIYSYISFFLNPRADFNVWDLQPNYTQSPLLVYAQARIHQERNENEALINLLSSRQKKGRANFYMLDFMLGKAKLNRLDDDADAPFLIFLSEYPGQNNVKAAYRYLSWHYFLRGSYKLSESYRQQAKTQGTTSVGSDKQAVLDVNHNYNIYLLKAQLYFDGGYYQRALDALSIGVNKLDKTEERIEYYYRLGRIYQLSGENVQAIQSYKKLFLYPESDDTYLGANAALQLGVIYENLSKKQEATEFYKKALSYSGFPFEDGIHQKAKAGLSRLKSKN